MINVEYFIYLIIINLKCLPVISNDIAHLYRYTLLHRILIHNI